MFQDKEKFPIILLALLLLALLASCASQQTFINADLETKEHISVSPIAPRDPIMINLPPPDLKGSMTLEETLEKRRSIRSFKNKPLTEAQIGQLLWAAQGITHPSGFRTAPSAGALYPLEIYAATPDGLFHYEPEEHRLIQIFGHDPRPELHRAALRQDSVLEAPMVIAITAVFERTLQRYGEARTPLYVHLEAGHAAQNILLQAVALELGAVPIGAFYDDQVKDALTLPAKHVPLYLIPVGHP